MARKKFDIIIWGATGFTGQLVVQYLSDNYGVGGSLRWAIAGRNQQKLEQLRTHCLPKDQRELLPVIIADSQDPASLKALVAQTRVLCTTVGPYAKYGTALVAACAEGGVDYCDLTGEVPWMAQMIEDYQDIAHSSGARIVHTCGFDSIPSDLGTWFLQQAMLDKHGVYASHVKARVGRNRGAASGGTIASMLNMMEQAKEDPSMRKLLADPYSLYPSGTPAGKDGKDQRGAVKDPDFKKWTFPFVMAMVNTRVVRRSNALQDLAWGADFRYDESQLAPSRRIAVRNALAGGAGIIALALGPTRRLAQRFLPKPGEGPDKAAREAGYYEIYFHGVHPSDRSKDMRVKVTGDMDPGYGSTSKMLSEAAVCLAQDKLQVGGGCWTPASALNDKLIDRLVARAGLTFDVVPIE
jgi:short subunit dehydrogenase-like uncharacterized protein